ncbi:uncharacterized protein LOC141678936 isoform X1 [Apium graveolens]|uniref:uncharacterized protein LOC141678936 isoform X1 n=1 Tax=Apium graveolens TaxID=4045 RepID=UPI003D7A3C24
MRITELLLSRCNRLSATVDNDWNAVEISQLKGDRKDFNCTRSSLAAEGFDVVYDINGREADEVEPVLEEHLKEELNSSWRWDSNGGTEAIWRDIMEPYFLNSIKRVL